MQSELKTPLVLSYVLASLMAVQAVLGRMFPEEYRDVEWIQVTWIGNDWITLLLAVPLLITGLVLTRRGSVRGHLLWLGLLGYAIYNYAFYLFGAVLNVFFPLYAGAMVLAALTMILALARTPVTQVAAQFRDSTPVRLIGGYFVFVAVGLSAVWLGMWAGYAFAGSPLPVETAAFQVVASLDLVLMVPALGFGGFLLWRQKPWGYVISAIAGVQGALYLLLLTTNSVIAILRELEEAPGQIPIWGTLAVATTIAIVVLLAHAKRRIEPVQAPER